MNYRHILFFNEDLQAFRTKSKKVFEKDKIYAQVQKTENPRYVVENASKIFHYSVLAIKM